MPPEPEVIEDAARLEAMEEPWRLLWRADPSATPFQHPAWLLPWWRHFGEGTLRCLSFRESGRLVGLLPMYRREEPGGARWRLLGVGTSDYLGGLFAGPDARSTAAAAARWLADSLPAGECCEWAQLPPESPLAAAPVPPPLVERTDPGEPTFEVTLEPGRPSSVEERVHRKFAHNLATARRRAERYGALRVSASDTASAPRLLEELIRLHAAEWGERGEPGVLRDPRVVAAHRDGVGPLCADGAATLYALEAGPARVAVVYALHDPAGPGRRIYSYLGGFDPAAAPISPGSLLLAEAMRHAAAAGAEAFDFLRGGERYKRRWGARERATVTRTFRRAPDRFEPLP